MACIDFVANMFELFNIAIEDPEKHKSLYDEKEKVLYLIVTV